MDNIMNKFKLKDAIKVMNYLGFDSKDFEPHQLRDGMNVELEHSDITNGDPILTAKIAMAHLRENKEYYKILKMVGL